MSGQPRASHHVPGEVAATTPGDGARSGEPTGRGLPRHRPGRPAGNPWTGPDLVSLGLLVEVAREGSISRAASRFSMSQPSASARLRALERRLGLDLLERRTGGSVPTDAGHLVVGWAGEVSAAVDRLELGVEALHARDRRSLRVAASYTIAEHLLPGWLAALRVRHPDAAVHLEVVNSHGVERRVADEDADLGFVEGPTVGTGLASRRVAADELVLVVAPGHPWSRRRAVVADQLAAAPLVAREPGSGTRAALERALRRSGRDAAHPAVELGSTAAVLRAVEQGVGPAVTSRLAITRELEEGRLVAVPVTGVDLGRSLHAVWRRGSVPGPLAAGLLDLVTATGDRDGRERRVVRAGARPRR